MSLIGIAVLLIVLCVSATRAQQCNDTTLCIPEGGNCTEDQGANVMKVCVDGANCISGECTRIPRLGESCFIDGPAPCYDEQYPDAIRCVSEVCVYSDIYFAGEQCQYSNSNFSNGGCTFGSTCDSSGICYNNISAECTQPQDCGTGQFCSGYECVPRLSEGYSCNVNRECTPELICTRYGESGEYTCRQPFNRTEGMSCDSNWDCAADLVCGASGVTSATSSTFTCMPFATAASGDCVSLTDCDYQCDCDYSLQNSGTIQVQNGSGHCVEEPHFTQAFIDQFRQFQQCTQANDCADFWINTLDGDYDRLRTAPNQCIDVCPKSELVNAVSLAGTCFGYVPPTQPPTGPPTTAPLTTTPLTTAPPPTATTAAPVVTASFTFKLSSCLTGSTDPTLSQLVQAFATRLTIPTSQIVIVSPPECPSLARQSGQPTYTAQISDPGGNALALAKDLSDGINAGTLVNAPSSLVVGSASLPQQGTAAPPTSPPTSSGSATLTAFACLVLAALLSVMA